MLSLIHLLVPIAHAQTTVVGGINSNGGGFFGISFGGGAGCFSGSLCTLGQTIIYFINGVLVPVLFAVCFIVFLYGVAKLYIFSLGNEESVAQGHRYILWALIGFVVMVSLWGLVNIVSNTIGIGSYSAPPLPTSY